MDLFKFLQTTHKRYIAYYFYFLLLLLFSCNDFPQAEQVTYVGVSKNTKEEKIFDKCTIQYYFHNTTKSFNPQDYKEWLKVPFKQWADSSRYLQFFPAESPENNEINFIFSDKPVFEDVIPNIDLVNPRISVLSKAIKNSKNNFTVYLRENYNWNITDLQSVVLFQIGNVLGLPQLANPKSVMSGQLIRSRIKLDPSDVQALRELYKKPCDWDKLNSLPFPGVKAELALATKTVGYVLLNSSEDKEQNQYWQYHPATNTWLPKDDYPLNRDVSENSIPLRRLGFVLNNTVYVGDSYSSVKYTFNKRGNFYRYDSTANDWIEVAFLPKIGYSAGRSFSLNNSGYLVLNTNVPEIILCQAFDPTKNRWSDIESYSSCDKPNTTGYCSFDELSNTFLVTTNQQVYLMSSILTRRSRRFSISEDKIPTWAVVNTIQGLDTIALAQTGFSIKGIGYGIVENKSKIKNIWKYENQTWSLFETFPGTGRITFNFVVGDRTYIGTDTKEFWVYKPSLK